MHVCSAQETGVEGGRFQGIPVLLPLMKEACPGGYVCVRGSLVAMHVHQAYP